MHCQRCGNALPAHAPGCPRCAASAAPLNKTRRLSVADLNKTRALVALDTCKNCGFMVFPADTQCASCGTWIERAWQQPAKPSKAKSRPGHKARAGQGRLPTVALGFVVSFVVLSLTALAWHFLARR